MFQRGAVSGLVRKCVIGWALSRPAPSSIPTSRLDLMRGRNYGFVRLLDEEGHPRFISKNKGAGGVYGTLFDKEGGRQERFLTYADAVKFQLEIIDYYGELEFHYRSAAHFLLWRLLPLRPCLLMWERLAQWRARHRTLVRVQRIEILRILLDLDQEKGISVPTIAQILHGKRVWFHPRINASLKYYELVLESFVESGEAEKIDNYYYSASSKAVATLAEFELQEERHRHLLGQQRMMIVLTMVLAVSAAASVEPTSWVVELAEKLWSQIATAFL